MDFIIIDFDCQILLADKTRIKELLGLSKTCEVVSMEENGWEADHWRISDEYAETINRCVFLTCFSGGIKKYHRELFANNPQITSWTVAVLDVEHGSYQKQYLSQIDQAFYALDTYYEVVFDCSETLQEVRKQCAFPAKTHKRCVIVSKNQVLAEKVRAVMEGYLPLWETAAIAVSTAEEYRFADAVMVVGEKAEDLAVLAPVTGLNRRYVWLDRSFPAGWEYDELAETAAEIMNGSGWNIADYTKCFYISNLEYEKFWQQIQSGVTGYSALKEHEEFVLWDVYGLPVVREDYTEENIESFLKENCCFAKIKERISGHLSLNTGGRHEIQ